MLLIHILITFLVTTPDNTGLTVYSSFTCYAHLSAGLCYVVDWVDWSFFARAHFIQLPLTCRCGWDGDCYCWWYDWWCRCSRRSLASKRDCLLTWSSFSFSPRPWLDLVSAKLRLQCLSLKAFSATESSIILVLHTWRLDFTVGISQFVRLIA